jgi:hypothetical protein
MNIPYSPVPPTDVEKAVINPLSAEEECLVKKASRWVIFLCFIQLLMAVGNLLCGGIITMCISVLFISLGIVGASKQRVRLLTVHFVYSLVLYIISLIGVVIVILYCDGCKWWIYLGGFFFILLQAIGMRHSRILISLLRKKQGVDQTNCVFKRCKKNIICKESQQNQDEIAMNPIVNQQSTVNAISNPTPNAPVQMTFPFGQIPAHQMMTMQMQPRMPQYYPMQAVQYPMQPQFQMMQPMGLAPLNFQPQNQGQPMGVYPVVYKI